MRIPSARTHGLYRSALTAIVTGPLLLVQVGLAAFPAQGTGCLSVDCHAGISPIRAHDSDMAQQIYEKGAVAGDRNGCVVCHGGNPSETTDPALAHTGAPEGVVMDVFTRFPSSMWANDRTCMQCHEKHVYAMHRCLMQTEAGKIQGGMWGWGVNADYSHLYGNYDIQDTDRPTPVFGTEAYHAYVKDLKTTFPNIFPDALKQLPEADVSTIKAHPEQGILTYLRSDCQRCHVGVRGRQKRGDYRGMGCGSCHIPYSNEGLYEGTDLTVPTDQPGHMLVHSIQSSRKAKVTVNGRTYSGMPQETCSTCHNRGKRIGVSFQGLMESAYGTPRTEGGRDQLKLHSKQYLQIRADHHHDVESRKGNPRGGLLCQDCHLTTAMHGNGNMATTTLASVSIECSDCHGIPDKYPWELPLGFGDEFGRTLELSAPRNLATAPLEVQAFATTYPARDGYLITARGNPFGNVVKDGDDVIVHSASGLDFKVPVLKQIQKTNAWQSPDKARTAMVGVTKHVQTMECYACHATWAPQCYGCHVKVDYSGGKTSTNWVASGTAHTRDGHTAESRDGQPIMQEGLATEGRSYLRWENPVLGVNGEGRVTPIVPGCQQITTVVDPNGDVVVRNKIWRTAPGTENGGPQGQRGMDMSPLNPHTSTRQARSCASCHASTKALGYGLHHGQYMKQQARDLYIEIMTAMGQPLSEQARVQIPAIGDLQTDLGAVVTRDGKQLQTVGHHWPLSGPLSQAQRENMERTGVCISCHQDIPKGTPSIKMLNLLARMAGLVPATDRQHMGLLRKIMRLTASVQILGAALGGALFVVACVKRKWIMGVIRRR